MELTRAKRAALGTVLSSLEGRAVVAEDIGRQLLTYGARCASSAACCIAHCKSRPGALHLTVMLSVWVFIGVS